MPEDKIKIGDHVYLPNGELFIIETYRELEMCKNLFANWGPETTIADLRRIADMKYQGTAYGC